MNKFKVQAININTRDLTCDDGDGACTVHVQSFDPTTKNKNNYVSTCQHNGNTMSIRHGQSYIYILFNII